jgi:hypothetical protein
MGLAPPRWGYRDGLIVHRSQAVGLGYRSAAALRLKTRIQISTNAAPIPQAQRAAPMTAQANGLGAG